MTDETVATENGTPSHTHSERGVSRNAVAVRRHQRRSDVELGWSECDKYPEIDVFTGYSGISDVTELDDNSDISDFFNFFMNDLIHHMKEQTNLYARQKIRKARARAEGLSPRSILGQWKTVTVNEMRKFLAIIIHMSISERMQIRDHWSKNPVISCNFCPNVMNRDRFTSILALFHVNDNSLAIQKGNPGHDPLHKVRPLLESIRIKCQNAYHPQENITVDEGMCKFRGRLSFKQYMPKKPSKYGIKLFMLCEAESGYVWNFDVYCGQESKTVNIVRNLLGRLAGKGHTVYTDRFYTSPTLAEELEKLKTGLVGTTMPNRKGMPVALKNAKLQKGQQIYRRNGNVLAVAWRDKRYVYMISTRHRADMTTFQDKWQRNKTKPACVIDYNSNKYGVDLSDQRMSYGIFDHRSVKWWRKLAFHIILICINNSCVLYEKVKKKKCSINNFMKLLVQDLAMTDDLETPPDTSGTQLSRLSGSKHFIEKIPAPDGKKRLQRKCKVCADRGRKLSGKPVRKDTTFQCNFCKIPLCLEPCFKLFHTKKITKIHLCKQIYIINMI